MSLRSLTLAFSVALGVAVAGTPAGAVEAPSGTTNFTPPAYVPNYFSNESGPFRGGADARAAPSDTAPIAEAPAPRGRVATFSRRNGRHPSAHAAKTNGRFRLAHGKAGATRHLAHAGAAHSGKAPGPRIAHAGPRSAAGKAVAAKGPVVSSKGKHIAAAHG